MIAMIALLAQAETIAAGVGGGIGGASLLGWLIRRMIRNADRQRETMEAKLDAIASNTHTTQVDVASIKSRLDAGDKRMDRIEGDMNTLKSDVKELPHRLRNGRAY